MTPAPISTPTLSKLLTPALVNGLSEQMEYGYGKFGPLTTDPFRAVTILTEEHGEVAKSLLEMRRARTTEGRQMCREEAVRELFQVMSVCAFMIRNLDPENYGA